MTNPDKAQLQKLKIALLIALAIIAIIVLQFFAAIAAACIAAFIFQPVFDKISSKIKSKSASITITIVVGLLAVFIPLFFIFMVSFNQVQAMIRDINTAFSSTNTVYEAGELLDSLNNFLSNTSGGLVQVSAAQVQEFVATVAKGFANFVFELLNSLVGAFPRLITNFLIFIYAFAALLLNNKKIVKLIEKLNPLGKEVTELYLSQAGTMTKSMVVVQLIIATLQGLIAAVSLTLAGFDYFILWFLVFSVLNIIPLGCGIITIPIGIFLLLTGNIWQGLLVLLTHFVIVTNIDNILRPLMLPKSVRLNPALTMVSVLGGVLLFGFLGIVIGPVLMILATSTIDVYLRVSSTTE